ncbi:hypothetical protein [Phormidesmis priestleyi]
MPKTRQTSCLSELIPPQSHAGVPRSCGRTTISSHHSRLFTSSTLTLRSTGNISWAAIAEFVLYNVPVERLPIPFAATPTSFASPLQPGC